MTRTMGFSTRAIRVASPRSPLFRRATAAQACHSAAFASEDAGRIDDLEQALAAARAAAAVPAGV